MAWTFYHHGTQNTEGYHAVGSVPDYHVNFISLQEVHLAMTYQDQMIEDTISFTKPIDKWVTLGNLYMGGNVPAQDW